MKPESLQVEDGNFTRIVNPVIENLIKIPFKGCELAVAIFIIRKTWGFHKTEDQISLTQFCEGVNRTRPVIVLALKNLQLVNVAKLVKQGNSKTQSSVWKLNKYIDTWQLVNTAKLVKHNHSTGLAERLQLVKPAKHTKDNTKDNTKETISKDIDKSYGNEDINSLLKEFETIRGFKSAGSKDRFRAKNLLNHFTREQITLMLQYCATQQYAPRVGSIEKLWYKRGDIIAGIKLLSNKPKITL
jgi:phage replication O-like protein O